MNDKSTLILLNESDPVKRRPRSPIVTADIATIPGIWPSTPLLQFNMFITQIIQSTAMMSERGIEKGRLLNLSKVCRQKDLL